MGQELLPRIWIKLEKRNRVLYPFRLTGSTWVLRVPKTKGHQIWELLEKTGTETHERGVRTKGKGKHWNWIRKGGLGTEYRIRYKPRALGYHTSTTGL